MITGNAMFTVPCPFPVLSLSRRSNIYDQLNRITKSRSLAFGNNAYAARSGEQKYDEDYSYDANGNILTLKRHDDKAVLSDDFNYSYYANSNKLLKHKTEGG